MKLGGKELSALELMFLVSVTGSSLAVGSFLWGHLLPLLGMRHVPSPGPHTALATLIFVIGLIVTSILVYRDSHGYQYEAEVPMHAGNATVLGGVGISRKPLIVIGTVWCLVGAVALALGISDQFF